MRCRRLAAALLAMVVAVPAIGVARPAAAQVTNPAAGVISGGARLIIGRVASARVFHNVDEEAAELAARYQRLIDAASAAGDARTVQLLQEEKATMDQILAADRQAAYDRFRRPEARLLLSTIASTKEVSKLLAGAGRDLATARSRVAELRQVVASGQPLTELGDLAARIERWSGIWSAVSGPQGRQLASTADQAAAALRQAGSVGTAADTALAEVDATLQSLSDQLATLQQVPRRPRSGGLFGALVSLTPAGALYEALREVLRPRLHDVPGYSRAELERRLDAVVNELMRRRLQDCAKAAAAELRALVASESAGTPDPARVTPPATPVDEQLPICGGLSSAEVAEVGGQIEQAAATGPTGPGPVGDRPTGGGVYEVTEDATTPGLLARMRRLDGGSIGVTERSTSGMVGLKGEPTGPPKVQLVVDLAAGQVSGSFDATYACDAATCPMGERTTGYARGTFGPLPFGPPPATMPADFPFTAEHWSGNWSGVWWAGGAVPVEVSLVGDAPSATGRVGGSYTTTLTAWVTVTLGPNGPYSKTALPAGWTTQLNVSIDPPGEVNPRWYLYLGASADIWDGHIALPPDRR